MDNDNDDDNNNDQIYERFHIKYFDLLGDMFCENKVDSSYTKPQK